MTVVTLASERDRERVVAALREHFAEGRLTLDELTARVALALHSRTRLELGRSLNGLPSPSLPTFARAVARGAGLIVLTGAWLAFSFLLLLLFALVLLIHGASAVEFVGFGAVWIVPTWLLYRGWRRGLVRPARHIRPSP
jgi:hypothetical protein